MISAALKLGHGRKISAPAKNPVPMETKVEVIEPEVQFSVNAPKNIPVGRTVREIFPLRNYVFFDLGSTEIPDRQGKAPKMDGQWQNRSNNTW